MGDKHPLQNSLTVPILLLCWFDSDLAKAHLCYDYSSVDGYIPMPYTDDGLLGAHIIRPSELDQYRERKDGISLACKPTTNIYIYVVPV